MAGAGIETSRLASPPHPVVLALVVGLCGSPVCGFPLPGFPVPSFPIPSFPIVPPSGTLAASEPPLEDPGPEGPPVPPALDRSAPIGSGGGEAPAVEQPSRPCDVDLRSNRALLDRARGTAYEVICQSARWFDDFFGDESYWQSASRLHGRLGLLFVGDEHEGLDIDTTFHTEVELPNLENKVNLFLRREDEQAYISDHGVSIDLLPELQTFESSRRWLLGAGYHPMGGASKGLDLDLGVELGSPLEPVARVRYRHYWMLGERSMLRTRPSVYWTSVRGFGAAGSAQVDRPIGESLLLRLSGGATINEITEGAAWSAQLSLFHMLDEDRALVYRVGVTGESDARYPVEEWVAEVRMRKRMFREWFLGEVVLGSSWIHETPGAPRDAGLYVGVGFELSFARDGAADPLPRSGAPRHR
jgi:hypothetical protein